MILTSIILLACSANPPGSNTEINELSLEEAFIKFSNLKMEVYPYDTSKPNEGRMFTPVESNLETVMALRAAERGQPIKQQNALLEGKALTFSYGGLPGSGVVNAKLDDKTIFRTSYGDDSPVDPVGGLWVLDGKWILELIHIKTHTENNTIYTNTRGDLIIDGISMNERFGYDESFAFQVMAGKPFYIYKKDGRIGFNYNGQHVQTGFNEILHYACCSGAARNPFHFQNMVSLFASNNEGNYYVEIGVFP